MNREDKLSMFLILVSILFLVLGVTVVSMDAKQFGVAIIVLIVGLIKYTKDNSMF